MARKMALVPESWLASNLRPTNSAMPSTEVAIQEEQQHASNLESLVDLLPKCYRSKAKTILHHLQDRITLNDIQRVVYDDGTVGSNVLDLIRYFVSPFVKERPIDAPDFKKMMNDAGVPEFVFAKKRDNILSNWKML